MEKVVSLGLFEVHFIYDSVEFERFIQVFPEHIQSSSDKKIVIRYKNESINIAIEKTDCNLDLDPSVIKGYQMLEHGDVLYLTAGVLVQRDFDKNELHIVNEMSNLTLDLSGFIETFIANVLYKWNLLALHGAALTYKGEGIAFIGKSHSGKSTTIMQLFNDSTEILSNDFFYLNLDDSNIYSLDKTYGVRGIKLPGMQVLSMSWDPETIIYENEQKYYDLEKNPHVKYTKKAQLHKIVFCEIENRCDYEIRRIDGFEVFQNYMNSSIRLSRYVNANYLELYRNIIDKYEFYKLALPNFSICKDFDKALLDKDFLDKLRKVQ